MWEPYFHENHGLIGPLSGEDLIIREILVAAWANFATYGDPTPPDSNFVWLPQMPNSEHLFWYISGSEPTMTTTKEIQDRWDLWKSILG